MGDTWLFSMVECCNLEGLQGYSFDVALGNCRAHILGERLLELAKLQAAAFTTQHVLWMHAQKAQERW
jgi:hypothetical protein